MKLTDQEVQEMRENLFETAVSLEELICSQEGLLPKRVLDTHKIGGYHDARKKVLNEARTQLRRVKTYMLRAGTLKAKTQGSPLVPGEHPANVDKLFTVPIVGREIPKEPEWAKPGWKPRRKPAVIPIAAALLACYVLGFWLPGVHIAMLSGFLLMVIFLGVNS